MMNECLSFILPFSQAMSFSISSALGMSLLFLLYIMFIHAWNIPLFSPIFEEISSIFPSIVFLYFFTLFLKKAFFSLLAILRNSAFSWLNYSLSPLPFSYLLSSAICKASFSLLHFFFLGMVMVTASCTML